jgi:hypothetical protein
MPKSESGRRGRSKTPDDSLPRKRTPTRALDIPHDGWKCPITHCDVTTPACTVRPVEFKQGEDGAKPRYHYCDGLGEVVNDANCGLVKHMLAFHSEYLLGKGEDNKTKKRAEGQLWKIGSCSCGFANKDGLIQISHFLSGKHHNVKHYRCTMKVNCTTRD